MGSIAQDRTYSLQAKTDLWTIIESSRIGATQRIRSVKQDPFPFCFSAAAALLWDQHRCSIDKTDCNKATQTSFLAITPAGQKLKDNQIDVNKGGSPYFSLKHIIDNGFVPLEKCNYISDKASQSSIHYVDRVRHEWRRHKDYSPYLERVYRKEFTNLVKNYNKNITSEKIDEILNSNLKDNNLASQILLSDSCTSEAIKDNRFVIKLSKEITKITPADIAMLDKLLEKKQPVLVSFCITRNKEVDTCFDLHTAIIIAKAKARHKLTGDVKTFYWVVNTWGEVWQDKNSDGWISAEHLLPEIVGELIWLNSK